jgi:hypothetical protein
MFTWFGCTGEDANTNPQSTDVEESTEDATAQRFVGGFTEVQSDGCQIWPPRDQWIGDIYLEFTYDQEQLSGQGGKTNDRDLFPFVCEMDGLQFTCDLGVDDDYFRKDEGYGAFMRVSESLDGTFESDEVLSGIFTLRIECVGDDCDEAIANAWEADGEFDYPSDLPCESLVSFVTALTEGVDPDAGGEDDDGEDTGEPGEPDVSAVGEKTPANIHEPKDRQH